MKIKKERLTPRVVIDPTSPLSAKWLPQICESFYSINQFTPIPLVDNSKQVEVLTTAPMFYFQKPERLSKGRQKPQTDYFVVFTLQELGSGSYGAAYPVLGMWKLQDSLWIFKPKLQYGKQWIVKTDAYLKLEEQEKVFPTYCNEYEIGRWVKHMGFKYEAMNYNGRSFLLMRRQEGITLKKLINKMRLQPDSVSIKDRLKLTINLINALETQANGIKLPLDVNGLESYLVHCDIKPANIIVDTDFSVRFIDYGLAKRSSFIKSNHGTLIYMDPNALIGEKDNADKVSDWFSLSRVIAEIWGDISANLLTSKEDLYYRNLYSELEHLLNNIHGLTIKENVHIVALISQMVQMTERDRASRETALEVFKSLYQERIRDEPKLLTELIQRKNIKLLTSYELMFILKSSRAIEFLDMHRDQKEELVNLSYKITNRLLELDNTILTEIKSRFTNKFSAPGLLIALETNEYSLEELAKLIQFKAPLDTQELVFWLNFKVIDGQEARWASICRMLYQATPNGDLTLLNLIPKNSFKYLFCKQFLRAAGNYELDQKNTQLLVRHLEIYKKHASVIKAIRSCINNYFKNTPLGKSLLLSLNPYTAAQPFVLAEEPFLKVIHFRLLAVVGWLNKLEAIKPNKKMKHRSTLLIMLKNEINSIKLCREDDWELVLSRLERVVDHTASLLRVDKQYELLVELAPYKLPSDFHSVIDRSFIETREKLDIMGDGLAELNEAFKKIKKINFIRSGMKNLGWGFDFRFPIDQYYLSKIKSCKMNQIVEYHDSMNYFYNFYDQTFQLFKILRNEPFGNEVKNKYSLAMEEINYYFAKILPPEKIQLAQKLFYEKALSLSECQEREAKDNPFRFFSKDRRDSVTYATLEEFGFTT